MRRTSFLQYHYQGKQSDFDFISSLVKVMDLILVIALFLNFEILLR